MADTGQEPGGGPALSVAEVRVEADTDIAAGVPDDEEVLHRILSSVHTVYGRDPELVRRDLRSSRACLYAAFEGGELAGYLLLGNYRDTLFHLGNRFDARVAAPFLADRSLGIWVVLLLHGEPGTAHPLEEIGDAMLGRRADGEPRRPLFLVSLFRGGDPRSWRLFQALGFKERGAASWFAEIEPAAVRGRSPGPEDTEVAWVSDLTQLPAADLADAYNEVFGEGVNVVSPEDMRTLASGPEFAREISLVIRERASREITGFLLASRRPGGVAHIDCIGVRRAWRGRGHVEGVFPLVCRRALEAGIRRLTFVTGRPEVRKLAVRRCGARVLEELVWLVRC